MTNILGPDIRGVTSRPARGARGATDTWFKDCVGGDPLTGTAFEQDFFNDVLAQFRGFMAKNGIDLTNYSDDLLIEAGRAQGANYRVDSGSANAVVIALDPVPASWADIGGAPLRVKIAANNTTASTLAITGVTGTKAITTLTGAALTSGDLIAGAIMEMIYDQAADRVVIVNLQKGVGPYSIGNIYTITSTQTWNRPAGCRAILVEGLGGGGGGGGSGDAAGGELSQGAGGGAGGYFRKLIISPLASYLVTIGAGGAGILKAIGGNGGATSWGSVCSGSGGTGGQLLSSGTSPNGSAPGGGGAGAGGDITSVGQGGHRGVRFGGANGFGGDGGSSIYGSGGYGAGVTQAGGAASGYGAGGGGSLASSASGFAGGAGAPGVVVVWEFY